ncbi:hypothetical protein [Burkholderia pseudomallei]|uniref:hypothetical protein n=1 Tax=Burkholderia pseudomallei TaxID=28450 RepID=UPI00061791D5|nr:hypothetical protein [Burkholderia pseudomallei]KKB71298.1 hypothetical protein BBMA_6011 [Burkholderia pseudomallei MSHR1079]
MIDDESKELRQRFHRDVDDIVESLISFVGLKHSKDVPHLSEGLYRWLDFRMRYIDPVPRRIVASNRFPMRLSGATETGLRAIEKRVLDGSDLNPFQGKRLIGLHDTSATKRQMRTDLLWADWGIHHLHLTDAPISEGASLASRDYFTERGDYLLYVMFVDDAACIIDVRPHSEELPFCQQSLIETVVRSWPGLLRPLSGTLARSNPHTAQEIDMGRRGGVSGFVVVDGVAYYPPGMGVTTASTATRVTLARDALRKDVDHLVQIVSQPDGQFQTSYRSGKTGRDFSLAVTERGLAVYEASADTAWVLGGAVEPVAGPYTRLTHRLTPAWLLSAMKRAGAWSGGGQSVSEARV